MTVSVRDANGTELKDGDNVTLVKDLKVKGSTVTLKRGTLIKGIRLTGDDQEVDCRHEKVKGNSCCEPSFSRKHDQGLIQSMKSCFARSV